MSDTVDADTYHPRITNLLKSINAAGVVLGNGSGQAAFDDYKLSGDIFSNFSYSSSLNVSESETGITLEATYTITNTSDSEFTISELGLLSCPFNVGSVNSDYMCLLEHTYLDEPITLSANGGIGGVVYTIEIPIP